MIKIQNNRFWFWTVSILHVQRKGRQISHYSTQGHCLSIRMCWFWMSWQFFYGQRDSLWNKDQGNFSSSKTYFQFLFYGGLFSSFILISFRFLTYRIILLINRYFFKKIYLIHVLGPFLSITLTFSLNHRCYFKQAY